MRIPDGLTPQTSLRTVEPSAHRLATPSAVVTGSAVGPVKTGGSLRINGVSVAIASASTATAVMNTINSTAALQGTHGVTASVDAAHHLVLTANTLGSGGMVSIGNVIPTGATITSDLGLDPSSSITGTDTPTPLQPHPSSAARSLLDVMA